MSNLRVFLNNSSNGVQHTATPACGNPPTPVPQRGPRPADACRIVLPLTLDTSPAMAPRPIAFDRQGDQFVLSSSNSADNLTWVGSHQNLTGVLDVARLTGALLRGAGPRAVNPSSVGFFGWIARYVITGETAFDDSSASSARNPDLGIEGVLLEVFRGSRTQGLVPILGNINLLRREQNLSEEIRERIQRVTGILDIVPAYRAFMAHFVTDAEREAYDGVPRADLERRVQVESFVRRTVIALANGRPLRFNEPTLAAVRAYHELHRAEIAAGRRPDFCTALQSALQERGGGDAPAAHFLSECRAGIELGARPALEAMRESLRSSLISPANLSLLQQAIAVESSAANMRIEWLGRRGSFGQVFTSLRDNIGLSGEGEGTRLTFNIAAFQQALRLMTSLGQRGEYDLSALAFLRRLFGAEGAPPRLRVFADGHFREVEWQLSSQDLGQIRALMASLSGRRRSSEGFASHGMPALLGTSCALGTGGIILSHTVPAISQNRGLQLGLGTVSSGLAGGGCLGFAGHYIWPAAVPNAVHNRYAWDLGTSAVGTALGIGTYLLINLLSGGNPGGVNRRFPVDPYGP